MRICPICNSEKILYEYTSKGRSKRAYRCRKCHNKKTSLRNARKRREKRKELLTQLGPLCNICGNPATLIDHDHVTQQIRGALCKRCNHGLANFIDNPSILRKAADYLEANRNLGTYPQCWLRGKRKPGGI